GRHHDFPVLGMHVLNPVGCVGAPFLRRVSQQGLNLRADKQPLALYPQFRNVRHCRKLLDETSIKSLSFGARSLVARALAYVYGNSYRASQLAIFGSLRSPMHFEAQTKLGELLDAQKLFP